MPPKPKTIARLSEFLSVPVVDAVLVLPRDGFLWTKQLSPKTRIIDRALDRAPRPGGHVPQLPGPPANPVWLVLTTDRFLVLDTQPELIRWKPVEVWVNFALSQIVGMWLAEAGLGYRELHLTFADGNHWEFTVTKGDRNRYLEFEAAVLGATGRPPGPAFCQPPRSPVATGPMPGPVVTAPPAPANQPPGNPGFPGAQSPAPTPPAGPSGVPGQLPPEGHPAVLPPPIWNPPQPGAPPAWPPTGHTPAPGPDRPPPVR